MGELETETEHSRAETAALLRELADQLAAGDAVTLEVGDTTVAVTPTEPVTVKLEGESDWSPGDTEAKQSIEIELVWWQPATSAADAALDIQ